MTILVRAATPVDYPAIARLTVAAYTADGQLVGGHGYGAVLADVEGRAGAGDLLVAADGDEILGAVLFVRPGSQYAELSRADEAEFRMLAVDPAAQGRGAGRALVTACVERASSLGCTAVVICVRDFSLPAQRLYDTFGFARSPDLDWMPGPDIKLLALRLDLKGQPG